MKIIKSVKKLRKTISNIKNLGFVPTMGGIHKGHLSLIKKSLTKCNKTLVSIYVNPKQFNNNKDYSKYPRNLNRDFLDIYLLHEPDRFINFDEIIFIFNKLKQEGLIGSFGLGFHRRIEPKQKFINDIVTLSMFHDSMLKNDKSDSNKIVHGALGWYKYRSTKEQREFYGSPIAFIRALTKVNQDSLFLVAPSNNRQLHNFCL